MPFTTAEIAKLLDAEVVGDANLAIKGFAPADRAQPGDLTFAENENYFARAEQSAASAIIVDGAFASSRKVLIRVANARIAFAKAMHLFFPEPVFPPGVHPTAIIAPDAQVDPTAHVGPYCIVGPKARLGARSVLEAVDCVGANCRLGEEVHLCPTVTLYPGTEIGNRVRIHSGTVIGSDGFGYVLDGGAHRKVPQIGNVVIRDDVEIGANVTIDRGALGPTIIGAGTKIDNLVHVAHNVRIGRHCLIMGQVGFAGSTELGDYGVIASQSGIGGHLKLGRQVTVGGKSGVMRDVPDRETVLGFPAVPDKQAKRQWVGIQKLPEILLRLRELEKRVPGGTGSLEA